MTLQFPSDPINGAVSGDYTYDEAKGAWRKNAALPVSVTHSDVAPSNPREGDQWWKSDEGTLFTYYNDGNSSQWVESTNVIANVEPNPIPAGAMMAWASDVVPANWLLCDGSAVSRSTYASLFAAIGTQYGSGDGTTTFNLPNLKGRTIVGKDGAQSEFDTLGETGGAKTHTLTTSEIPSHTHGTSAHSHTFSGTTSTNGSHTHVSQPAYRLSGGPVQLNGEALTGAPNNGLEGGFNGIRPTTTSADGNHSHTYSGTTSEASPNTTSAGGGEAHNNLQPYIVLNYIIKFSAGETPGDSQLAVRVGTLETQNNATPLSQNYLLNGAFDIWQRGTTTTSNIVYLADRWLHLSSAGTQTVSRSTDVPTNAGVSFSLSFASTSGTNPTIIQRIESANAFCIAGKTVTLSVWAKSTVGTTGLTWSTATPASTDTWTGSTADKSGTFTASMSVGAWTRYSATFVVSNLASTGYQILITRTAASTSTTTLFAGVQLEEGSFATPFRRNAPSIQAELAACQRYYYQSAQAYGFYNIFNSGNMQSTTFRFPVTMRTSNPALTVYDNVGTVNRITIANAGGTSQNGITPPATIQYTADGFMWVAGGMGGTVGNNGMVYMSRFDASAEL